MALYVVRRLLQAIPVLIGVSMIIFLIVYSTPGDPYAYLFGPKIDPTLKARLMREKGLLDPLPVQYVRWVKETASGNLGYSLRTGQEVKTMLTGRLKNTLLLTVTALTLGLLVAIPTGILSGTRQYSLGDYAVTTFAFMGISLPSFFTALLAIYFLAVKFPIFPMNGITTAGQPFSYADLLHHLALPALTLSLREVAGYARYTRSSMLEVMRQDYVRTARSKGLSERIVVYKHAFRNSLIPVVTLLGFSLPELFGGAVVFEGIFTWPGVGDLTLVAVGNRDYPVLMAVNMLFAFLVIVGNLVADVLYAMVDPRIRYA